MFGTVRKDRVLQGFWPDKIKWKFNIYPSHSGGFFITKKAQKKIGLYNLKFRYSSDRDLIYRMIVKHKLNGICTKKSEILAKFDLDGVSSRIGFFNKLLEETRIRLHNKQNFLFVTMLVLAHSLNKLLNLPYSAIPKLIKNIHFNPKHPENHNIKITNKKEPYIKVRKNDKWELQNKDETITDLIDRQQIHLNNEEIEEKIVEKCSISEKCNIDRCTNLYNSDDKDYMKRLYNDSELMVINNS